MEAKRSTIDGKQDRTVIECWPEGVATPLILSCADCGTRPKFDYTVSDEFWRRYAGNNRLGVICLACLDKRCGGRGLATAIERVQWTGTQHTVVFDVALRHEYAGDTQ